MLFKASTGAANSRPTRQMTSRPPKWATPFKPKLTLVELHTWRTLIQTQNVVVGFKHSRARIRTLSRSSRPCQPTPSTLKAWMSSVMAATLFSPILRWQPKHQVETAAFNRDWKAKIVYKVQTRCLQEQVRIVPQICYPSVEYCSIHTHWTKMSQT